MKSMELRQLFLDYFIERGHKHVASAPLIPVNDPTLLFTSSGMVQFKDLWAGLVKPLPYATAVTVQKCLRAGGKGSDLENVGKTLRHHTFFEMLGNFSFGDYFKLGAIQHAWDFVTEVMNFPTDKLYVSIYKDDEEAFKIWSEVIGVDSERIVPLGEKDNFWGPAGDTGACGPCSELHLDMGEDRSCAKPDCYVGCDCERYLEFWNIVFPQFDQQKDGSRPQLANRGIDTGMGLERLATISQGVDSPYETDLTAPIVEAVCDAAGVKYKSSNRVKMSVNVIADHMRALTFTLSEGIIPSNEGRGYVLRRILRRASRHAKKLGLDKPYLNQLVDVVVQTMGDAYPELKENPEQVAKIIRFEEERFLSTLSQGLEILSSIIEDLKEKDEKIISGEDAFKLYDTYGFPLDITRDTAQEYGMSVDEAGFESSLTKQKEMAKRAWKGAELDGVDSELICVLEEHGSTDFVGYETTSLQTEVIALLDNESKLIDSAAKDADVTLILRQTPFYGESGGQVGDVGVIKFDEYEVAVSDTQKTKSDIYLHKGKVTKGAVKVGNFAVANVDEGKRLATMRNHSATHLLQRALKKIVGKHITQSGSFVSPEALRFDFTHLEAVTPEQLREVERLVNEQIMINSPVEKKVMSIEDARKTGATATFGEKYGDEVRVISMGDFTAEFCGGTHLDNTGQIGAFVILSEASIAAGTRRIEALTGMNAVKYIQKQLLLMSDTSRLLSATSEEIPVRIESLQKDLKQARLEVEKLRHKSSASAIEDVLASPRKVGDVNVITHKLPGLTMKELRNIADLIRDRAKNTIAVIGTEKDGKVSLIAVSTNDVKGRVSANDVVKQVAQIIGGSGGGRPDLAQAGGKLANKLDQALESVEATVKSLLEG